MFWKRSADSLDVLSSHNGIYQEKQTSCVLSWNLRKQFTSVDESNSIIKFDTVSQVCCRVLAVSYLAVYRFLSTSHIFCINYDPRKDLKFAQYGMWRAFTQKIITSFLNFSPQPFPYIFAFVSELFVCLNHRILQSATFVRVQHFSICWLCSWWYLVWWRNVSCL